MAHDNTLRRRCDGKMGNIGRCLAAAQYHNGLVDAELGARLELGRVHAHRDVLDTGNLRDTGRDVQTGAHSDGITLPL